MLESKDTSSVPRRHLTVLNTITPSSDGKDKYIQVSRPFVVTKLRDLYQLPLWQYDQMAILLFQYLAINSNENLPNRIGNLTNSVQNFAKY